MTAMICLTRLRKLALPIAVVTITAAAANALGSTLTLIPTLSGDTDNQGRAITPDGQYVGGLSGTRGFLYAVANGSVVQPLSSDNAAATIVTGIGYRTSAGTNELLLRGLGAGYVMEWMTRDGGVSFGSKRRDTTFAYNVLPAANSLGSQTGSEVYFVTSSKNQAGQPVHLDQLSGPWAPTMSYSDKGIPSGNTANMNGVSASGRAVGYRVNNTDNVKKNYLLTWDVPGGGAAKAAFFYGLDETTQAGEAFSVSADGNTIFGRSPVTGGDGTLYSYKATFLTTSPTNVTQLSTNQLPRFGDETGSSALQSPYGCSTDGRYAVGMDFRGEEKAVLWDAGDPDPANWTVTDLTDLATSEGILGGFIRLTRGYSVGINAAGHPVVTGVGSYSDGVSISVRAFVMVVSSPTLPQPVITSVAGAGTTSVTVTWTNALVGTNYVLQYNTNLNATNWAGLSPVTASDSTASQTDTPPAGDRQRFYRVLMQ